MSHELNFTYVCPNLKHTKTYRRNRYDPVPICPICRQRMEILRTPTKYQCEIEGIDFKRAKKNLRKK